MARIAASLVRGFGDAVTRMGALDGCLYALGRLLASLSGGRVHLHKYLFFAQPVKEDLLLPPHRGRAMEVRTIEETDSVVNRFPRPSDVIQSRYRQGAVCLALFVREVFAGFIWLLLGPYREDEVRCRYIPASDCCWDFDMHVEPAYRGGIAFLKLWEEANRYLTARAIRWSLSRISAFNRPSIQSHRRLGAKHIGTAFFISAGSAQLCLATVSPYFHLSTNCRSVPRFELHPPARPDSLVPANES